MSPLNPPKFALGQIVATPGAVERLQESQQSPADFLNRHVHGDWGEVGHEDWQLNDVAVSDGSRILSAYKTRNGVKLWIITESDRSSTCILLPEEY